MQVMYARQHERQAMKDALEMALLTSVSHPFIIHVGPAPPRPAYACMLITNRTQRQAAGANAADVK